MKFFMMYTLVAAFVTGNIVADAGETRKSPKSRKAKVESSQTPRSQSQALALQSDSKKSDSKKTVNENKRSKTRSGKSRKPNLSAKSDQSSDPSQASSLKKLEQRFTSIEAQLSQIIRMANRNANDLKTVQARMDHQLITDTESVADLRKQIKTLETRMGHQTIQARESSVQIKRQLSDLKSQISHDIIVSAEKMAVAADENGKRFKDIDARLAHETSTRAQSALDVKRLLANLKAQVSEQVLAANEKSRRLNALDARLANQTISGARSAHEAKTQLADLKARLGQQFRAAHDQSQRIARIETSVIQQVSATDDKPESANNKESGETSVKAPKRLLHDDTQITRATKQKREKTIEAKLARLIKLLERLNDE